MLQSKWLPNLLYGLIALFAVGAGVWVSARWQVAPQAVVPAVATADTLYAIKLPDLENRSQSLNQWRDKVLVVNFWATWCAPCREEIPVFVRLQTRYRDVGVQFVGISIDQADKTREFSSIFNINYPSLIGNFDTVELSQKVGNTRRALPFTVVLDRKGRIAATELGGITEVKLESLLKSLL